MHDLKNSSNREEKGMHSARLILTISIILFFLAQLVSAEMHYNRNGMWGGIDAGVGLLKQAIEEEDKNDKYLFLGFKGGYTINPRFLIGLELSGWLLETSNYWDPDEGKGISQVFLVTQLYPSKESGLFAKVGGGYASIWSNRPNETRRKSGWALTVGGGYDYFLYETIALSPFVTFNYGETENWDYKAITFGLGLTFP